MASTSSDMKGNAASNAARTADAVAGPMPCPKRSKGEGWVLLSFDMISDVEEPVGQQVLLNFCIVS